MTLKTFLILLVTSWFSLSSGWSQDEFDPLGEAAEAELPKQIRVQVEFIEVPQETLTELLAGPQKSADDTKLRAKLQELINKKKAKMLETQMVTARSGQKATSESIHEFIYPTEYEPPVLPGEKENIAAFPSNPATPTAFETRNVGSTLEIEPVIGEDNRTIDLRFAPEIIYHTGNEVWAELRKGKNKNRIQMPNFYTLRITTGVVLMTGQPFLAAALSPKDDAGEADFSRKVLVFVKADVLTVGR